jgi:hypothetical protein
VNNPFHEQNYPSRGPSVRNDIVVAKYVKYRARSDQPSLKGLSHVSRKRLLAKNTKSILSQFSERPVTTLYIDSSLILIETSGYIYSCFTYFYSLYFTQNIGSMQRQYSRTSSSGSSSENLPPRTLARLAREIRDIHKDTPDGINLILDGDCGGSLGELVVSELNLIFPHRDNTFLFEATDIR